MNTSDIQKLIMRSKGCLDYFSKSDLSDDNKTFDGDKRHKNSLHKCKI